MSCHRIDSSDWRNSGVGCAAVQGECAMKKEFKFGTDLDGKAKEELIRLAYEGKERSYSPYSGFQVGAALLAENGTVYLV